MCLASHPAPSGPSPMVAVASVLPLMESITPIFLPSQTGKSRLPATSKARPDGDSQPASGHSAVSLLVCASRRTISLLSSMLSKTIPLPSTTANSGLPGSGMVATTLREATSMTVTSLLRPLKAHTVCVAGSKMMPSGLVPAGMVATVARVARSKTTTALPPPSEM